MCKTKIRLQKAAAIIQELSCLLLAIGGVIYCVRAIAHTILSDLFAISCFLFAAYTVLNSVMLIVLSKFLSPDFKAVDGEGDNKLVPNKNELVLSIVILILNAAYALFLLAFVVFVAVLTKIPSLLFLIFAINPSAAVCILIILSLQIKPQKQELMRNN